MNDVAYETFLSGDKIVDASFIYMLALVGIVLLVATMFKFVKWVSNK